MNRRDAIIRGFAGAAGMAFVMPDLALAAIKNNIRSPNVVIFHTDDQSFDSIAAYGNHVLTPNIDGLAAAGIIFNRGYVPTGVCMPSRYSLITGEFPSRCRHRSFREAFPSGVPAEPSFNTPLTEGQPTIATALKNAGYVTGFVGKWHLGYSGLNNMKQLPKQNEWAAEWKTGDDYRDPKDNKISEILAYNQELVCNYIRSYGFDFADRVYENPESYSSRILNQHNPEWITSGALEFIDKNHDKPFFLHLNHTLHHIPHPQVSLSEGDPRVTPAGYLDQVPDVMPKRSEIIERVRREGYPERTAYCTWMDEALGAVMRRIAEYGLSDDTIIVYISDNNMPAKGTIYEGGVNVPLIVRYPRAFPGGRISSALAQNLDFVPTLLELCGAETPESMHIDGTSLMPLLKGKQDQVRNELFCEIGWTRAVVTEDWKYLALRYPASAEEYRKSKKGAFPWIYHNRALEPQQHNAMIEHPAFFHPDQLYNIPEDPNEIINQAYNPKHSQNLQDLKVRLTNWLDSFDNPFGEFHK